ncbi:MAG TPA: hypothetical protein VF779_12990, partial [Pyrinomonadaceae bacterium]
ARAAYQKVSASATETIAEAARQHLTELGPPVVVVNTEHPREARTTAENQQPAERETTVAAETPQPTPPMRAVTPAATTVGNGASRVDYDAYYFQALNVVNGRDLKKIERAELLHALYLFQSAALGGKHQADAQRYADRLGKEYDRRRKL